MKKTILAIIFAFIPLVAGATPTSVDRLGNSHIEPLIKSDFIQSRYFNATSSSDTNSFAGPIHGNAGLELTNGNFTIDNGTVTQSLQTSASSIGLSFGSQVLGFSDGDYSIGLKSHPFITDLFQSVGETFYSIAYQCEPEGSVQGGPGATIFRYCIKSNPQYPEDYNYLIGNLGIGTTTSYAKLGVAGQVVADYYTATTTTASTFPYASTTQLTTTGTTYLATAGGNVGIGTTSPASALDIVGSQIRLSNSVTNSTNKAFRFATRNFLNSQNDFLLVFGQSKTSGNTLLLGGGQAGSVAASAVSIFAGTGNNTDTGTSQLTVTSNGVSENNSSTTLASFSYASSTSYYGAGLASCAGASNAVTWSSGQWGCNTIAAAPSIPTTQGWLGINDSAAVISSTSPTVNYITATSTTATSTFAGGIQTNLLNVTSTTATSTFANGINLTSGCIKVNGSCATGSGATSPGGTNTQLQINSGGSFAGTTTNPLYVGNILATSTTASRFTGGITAYASSTIGNGTGQGGLLISGNATTTGSLIIGGTVPIASNGLPSELQIQYPNNSTGGVELSMFRPNGNGGLFQFGGGNDWDILATGNTDTVHLGMTGGTSADMGLYNTGEIKFWNSINVNLQGGFNGSGLFYAQNIQNKGVLDCSFTSMNGFLATDGSGNEFCDTTLSDETLKKNIAPVDPQDILDRVMKINTVTYEWDDSFASTTQGKMEGVSTTTEQVGLLAQEVQKVFPDVVKHFKVIDHMATSTFAVKDFKGNMVQVQKSVPVYTDKLTIDYPHLTAYLFSAIQAQQAEDNSLKAQIDAITTRINNAGIK